MVIPVVRSTTDSAASQNTAHWPQDIVIAAFYPTYRNSSHNIYPVLNVCQ